MITGAAGEEWCQGADLARHTLGVRVDVCVIGGLHGYRDPMGEWERIACTGPHGCLLVRPDGHIAWRTKTAPDAGALVAAIARVVDRPLGSVQDGDLDPAPVSVSTTA